MNLQPHHDGSALYVSSPAPRMGDTVTVRIRIPEGSVPVARVFVRSNPDHEPHWDQASLDGTVDGWHWWSASIIVANPHHGYRFHLILEDGSERILSQAGMSDIEPLDAFDFAIVAENEPPAWMTDAVMYQIFPDRFARSVAAEEREVPEWAIPAAWDDPVAQQPPGRSKQLYGGDLDGITEKLGHLEDLGVNLVYHTPIFAGRSNHRYDASSFAEVDPLLGGDEAYIRLLDAAHARGIRVIGDLTTNHSGIEHEWFQAAFGHPGAPESSFYYFNDADQLSYESWLNVPSLPKFNWSSPELRRRFIDGPESVVGKWLSAPFGTDGWRIDVASMTGRHGAEDLNAEIRRTLRRTMQEVNAETLLIAESTNDASSDLPGDAWHGAMSYPAFTRSVWAWLGEPKPAPYHGIDGKLTDEPWFFGQPAGFRKYSARQFFEQFERFSSMIPWRVRLGNMLALNTHDIARFQTHAAEGTIPVAVGLSMTLPGIPTVYAGDEFGLTGVDGEAGRMPMPWGAEEVPEVAERFTLYRDLIGLRRTRPALATGGLRWLHVDEHAVIFARESEDESIVVLASRHDVCARLPAPLLNGAIGAEVLFGDARFAVEADGRVTVSAEGPAFAMWRLPGVRIPTPVTTAGVAGS